MWNRCSLSAYDTFVSQNEAHNEPSGDFLQYTAIATVADVMELVGENRILVRKGLSYLNHTNHIGLRALMEVCGIAPEQVRAYHIGFILGPCFNAAGRLDTIVHALALLESKEYDQALALAGELWAMNEERKELTRVGTGARSRAY